MNYIRACFCIDQYLGLAALESLCGFLERHKCRTVNPPKLLDSVHWYEQSLVWEMPDVNVMARLIQIPHDFAPSMISLDVDASFWLPGGRISYDPARDAYFKTYTRLLLDLINYVKPYIGLVDYDADLLCTDLPSNSFRAWGNYLSSQFLSSWTPQEIKEIERLVDEYHPADQHGILTYIHPLGYSEPTDHQIKFWEMIKSHIPLRR